MKKIYLILTFALGLTSAIIGAPRSPGASASQADTRRNLARRLRRVEGDFAQRTRYRRRRRAGFVGRELQEIRVNRPNQMDPWGDFDSFYVLPTQEDLVRQFIASGMVFDVLVVQNPQEQSKEEGMDLATQPDSGSDNPANMFDAIENF